MCKRRACFGRAVRRRTVAPRREVQAAAMPHPIVARLCLCVSRRHGAWLALLCLCPAWGRAQTSSADALRTRYEAVSATAPAALGEPGVVLVSSETSDQLQGEVYAVVDQPLADTRSALAPPEAWCAILVLHLNVQYCRPDTAAGAAVLVVGIGRKVEQPLAALTWLRLDYRVGHLDPDLFSATLQTAHGPYGTTDFQLSLEAVAHPPHRTLVHLTYRYRYGALARVALQAYLATIGAAKVGFSVVGQGADGQPQRAAGLRGAVERNVLRYHFALAAYLAAASLPTAQQQQARLDGWFAATERHPLQLREVTRDAYLSMKHSQIERQATQPPPAVVP